MATPIGGALDTLRRKQLAAAFALGALAVDFVLCWRGYYATPARCAILIGAVLLYGRLTNHNNDALGLTLQPRQGWRYWLVAIPATALVLSALSLAVLGVWKLTGHDVALTATRPPSEMVARFYYACVNAPVLEEAIYRFVLCVPAVALLGPRGAIALSGAVFAGMHFVHGNASPDNFIAGFFLAWVFLKSGTLAVPIILHALWNAGILATEVFLWYWQEGLGP